MKSFGLSRKDAQDRVEKESQRDNRLTQVQLENGR